MSDRDPRIGKHGEFAPTVCAATGQMLHSKPHTTHKLGDGYYYRTLAKAAPDHDTIQKELAAIISPPRRKNKETDE